MEEFDTGKLNSGSKGGPEVTNPKQAIAIGLSEERKEGHHVAPSPKIKGSHHSPISGMSHASPKSHGYGHDVTKRQGSLRLSGHPKAHRLGK
jgi:hypothetical protein